MNEDRQSQIRVAWLYYMEGLTQAEIAGRLGTTRLRVNRLLGEARASGLVSINLNSRLQSCLALEERLRSTCGLREAVIVPTPEDGALVQSVIGRAAGDYVSQYVERTRPRGFGVGWGGTLRDTIRHVRPGHFPDMTVTSMMGGLTQGSEINTFEIATELARRWAAECRYLAAPLYAGTPGSRDTILAQDVFQEEFDRIRNNDVALLSIGDLTRRSFLVRYGLPRDVSTDDLAAQGAVGDIAGQFVDAQGRPIDHPINRRVIGLPISALAKIPAVILASGGSNKTAIIAAMLRGRLASVLICDERTAAAALALVEG
jgi:lsr operon transcriptional repressor